MNIIFYDSNTVNPIQLYVEACITDELRQLDFRGDLIERELEHAKRKLAMELVEYMEKAGCIQISTRRNPQRQMDIVTLSVRPGVIVTPNLGPVLTVNGNKPFSHKEEPLDCASEIIEFFKKV